MKITVEIKNVYGKDMVYPICDKARLFADIAGTKTISMKNWNRIKKLGFNIELKIPEIKFQN